MIGRRRLGRPGLLGTMARTAVIAGTASTVHRAITNTANDQAQDRAAADAWYAQQSAAAAPAPAVDRSSAASDDLMAALDRLADMRAAGTLTDDEFAAAKAKLLA